MVKKCKQCSILTLIQNDNARLYPLQKLKFYELNVIEFLRHNGPLKCHKMIKKGKHNCVLQTKIALT
jgi:hypothetical protein